MIKTFLISYCEKSLNYNYFNLRALGERDSDGSGKSPTRKEWGEWSYKLRDLLFVVAA